MSYARHMHGLTNATVAAAMTDFVTTVLTELPLPPGAPKMICPQITAEGWCEGDVCLLDAMKLGTRVYEAHQAMAFQGLAKKLGLENLPSDRATEAVTERIQEMLLGAFRGEPVAMELMRWIQSNSDTALLESVRQVFAGRVTVTIADGMPIHLTRVEE